MKKLLILSALVASVATGAFAGSSSITLTAPQLTNWTLPTTAETALSTLYPTLKSTAISTVNTQLTTIFGDLQQQLNDDYFSNLHDLNNLSKGFANANSAAFDNASLLSFQTYDLFGIMLGTNISGALPSTDPNQVAATLADITTKGDAYLGLATGGVAGQVGLNTGLFLVKNLYVSAKFGMVPSVSVSAGSGDGQVDVNFKQTMFGVGVNYTLFPQIDLLFGFIKWRGLSLGSGLIYNSNTTTIGLSVKDQVQTQSISTGLPTNIGLTSDYTDPTVTATVNQIKAKLTVDNSSVVVPIELMTSLQALWLFNVGLGAGVDVTFPTSRIKLAGSANLDLTGIPGASFSSSSVAVTATDSQSSGDMFVPRIASSVGFNVAVFKFEIPVSYYPTTKAFAFGISTGVVW